MHIAGLNLPLLPPKILEVLVILSTSEYLRFNIAKIKRLAIVSESKGGCIRPESMPTTFLGRIISPIHGLALFVPPLIYMTTLVLNRFESPEWMAKFSLPTTTMGLKNALRTAACAASFILRKFIDSTYAHLGDQWHVIGRRENSRVVRTGPYAWVRHPGYSTVLFQEALWSIMFWSYVPLIALGITALAFAIKMPIEENLIQKDDGVREEYQQYMKEVPARILPFVW